MKKLLLLCILVPFSVFAKYYPGTVTFEDETTKTGFIKLPEHPWDKKIKFRPEEKGEVEKIEATKIRSIQVLTDDKRIITYYAIYQQKLNIFKPSEIKISKDKVWLQKIKGDKLGLYCSYVVDNKGGYSNVYYLKKEKDNYAFKIDYEEGGFVMYGNRFNSIKYVIEHHFNEDCPNLANLLDRDVIRGNNRNGLIVNGLIHIIDLYDKNCGAN